MIVNFRSTCLDDNDHDDDEFDDLFIHLKLRNISQNRKYDDDPAR